MQPDAQDRGRARRRWRRSLLLLLTLGALLVVLVLSRSALLGPWLVRLAGERLERLTGCEVTVERVSGSWYEGLVLEGLEMIARKPRGPLRYLRGRAVAEYSLWGLLHGRTEDLTRLDFQVEDLRLDLAPKEKTGRPGPKPPQSLPPGIWNVQEAQIELPGKKRLTLENLFMEWSSTQASLSEIRADGQRMSANLAGLRLDMGERMVWEGEASLSSIYRDGLLEIVRGDFASAVDEATGAIRRGVIDLRKLPENAYSFRFPIDLAEGLLTLGARVRSSSWNLRAQADELLLKPLAPLAGRIVPGDWLRRWPEGRLNASLNLLFDLPSAGQVSEPPTGRVSMRLNDGHFLGYPCDLLEATGSFDAHGWTVERGWASGPVMELFVQAPASLRSSVPLEIPAGSWPRVKVPRSTKLTVQVAGSVFDVPAFLEGAIGDKFGLLRPIPDPLEPIEGCAAVELSVRGPLGALTSQVELEGFGMHSGRVPWGDVRLSIKTEPGALHFPRIEIDGPLATASGALEFPRPGDGWIWLAGEAHDPRHMAAVAARFGPQLDWSGSPFNFQLAWRKALTYGHTSLAFQGDELRWDEKDLLDLDVLMHGDPWHWTVERGSLALDRREEGESLLPGGAVQVEVREDQHLSFLRDEELYWNLETSGLSLRSAGRPLELEDQAALRFDNARGELDSSLWNWVAGEGATGGQVQVQGERRAGRWSGALGLNQFDSDPWLGPFLPPEASLGVLDGGLRLRPTAGDLDVLVDLTSQALRWKDELPSVRARLRGLRVGDRLELEALEMDSLGWGRVRVEGSVSLAQDEPWSALRKSPFDLKFEGQLEDLSPLWKQLPRLPLDFATAGEMRCSGVLSGDGQHVLGHAEIAGNNLYASGGPSEQRAYFGPAQFEASLELSPTGFELSNGRFDSPEVRARVAASSSQPVPQDPALWLEYGQGIGTDETVTVLVPDLNWLSAWLPNVRRTSGSLMAALPPRADRRPDAPWGRLFLTNGLVRFRGSELFVENLNGELRLSPERLAITQLEGEFGAAKLSISGGVDRTDEGPYLDLDLAAEDMLLARSRGLRIRADAGGDGAAVNADGLHIEGPIEALEVSGKLSLRGSRFTRSYDLLGWLSRREKNAPETGEGIQLRLAETGPLANMKLDIQIADGDPFRIDNNLVEGSLRPDLRLMGTGRLAFLQGPIYIDPSRVNLPSGFLQVTGGTILFSEENPFVPRLDVSAEQRIRGYDITLSVSGTTQQPEVTIASNPPLPGDDVFVLLLTGQIPAGSWGDRTERAGQVLAVYLAKDALVRAFGDDGSSGESALDRLEITMGQDVSRQGVETMHLSYRLGARPRGSGVTNYLTAERDEYDKENFGFRILFRFP